MAILLGNEPESEDKEDSARAMQEQKWRNQWQAAPASRYNAKNAPRAPHYRSSVLAGLKAWVREWLYFAAQIMPFR